jgi:hypothetical protein
MHNSKNAGTRLVLGAALLFAAGLGSGCMSSPTYGTDKTANRQLVSDLGGMFSFSDKKRAPIDYAPRPELVKPAAGETTAALPAPQDSVVSSTNPDWPESPEQRLARVREEADANIDNPNYVSPIDPDMTRAKYGKPHKGSYRADDAGLRDVSTVASERAEFDKRMKERQQGSSTSRKFLSDPPLTYREASADAPIGELGEDEYRKERRLKREARKKKATFLDDINPF